MMNRRNLFHHLHHALLFLLLLTFNHGSNSTGTVHASASKDDGNNNKDDWQTHASNLLAKGDAALTTRPTQEAIDFYERGIQLLPEPWSSPSSSSSTSLAASLLLGEDNNDDEEDHTNSDNVVMNDKLPDTKTMEVILSLHTNLGTALSYLGNDNAEKALNSYKHACLCYQFYIQQLSSSNIKGTPKTLIPKEIKTVATQSYFFLGMTYQDMATSTTLDVKKKTEQQQEQLQQQREEYLQNAARAYAKATKLDPRHWSSYANMGVVLADVGMDDHGNKAISLEMYEEGIMSYQMAIDILTGNNNKNNDDSADNDEDEKNNLGPTDPPENKREVVAELQYRIGLCLVPFLFQTSSGNDGGEEVTGNGGSGEDYNKKTCTLSTPSSASNAKRASKQPTAITRSCLELAAYSFMNALQSYPRHEGANNALNLVTADATFGTGTDVKEVEKLFEGYASSFEDSLVQDLRYNGFHRMRRGFGRAMEKEGKKNKFYNKQLFPLVLDAGCGTGLSGEVFRNISQTMIGVDLSPTMIEHAKQSRPNLYDEYKVGDITEIIRDYGDEGKQISLIVASDTFIYFNDLNDLFASMHAGLEEGGYAAFSLENVSRNNEKRLSQVKPQWKWQITPSGRIAHRKDYVEEVAKAHSFETVHYEKLDNFREERGSGVRGHFFVLKKIGGVGAKDEL